MTVYSPSIISSPVRENHMITKSCNHIAIIMDGNRRWAKKRFLPSIAGHWAGAAALKRTVRAASDFDVKILTVYAFSTENWLRPQMEIKALFKVLESYLLQEREDMVAEGVRLNFIGDISRFPEYLQQVIQETKAMTAYGQKIELVLALNYGSRDEITRAVHHIIEDVEQKKLKKHEITEDLITHYLDTNKMQDPDLLIRTSGEMRLSNFLLWQLSYAEVYVTSVLWPDFSKQDLENAITEYQRREKRNGV
ncbi:MAG: isoprenyl transferase [Chlamydiales bacterium]|nr:isoprenyl transferase [Chlamydiales bacterium]